MRYAYNIKGQPIDAYNLSAAKNRKHDFHGHYKATIKGHAPLS
jgi:hypothetical protein